MPLPTNMMHLSSSSGLSVGRRGLLVPSLPMESVSGSEVPERQSYDTLDILIDGVIQLHPIPDMTQDQPYENWDVPEAVTLKPITGNGVLKGQPGIVIRSAHRKVSVGHFDTDPKAPDFGVFNDGFGLSESTRSITAFDGSDEDLGQILYGRRRTFAATKGGFPLLSDVIVYDGSEPTDMLDARRYEKTALDLRLKRVAANINDLLGPFAPAQFADNPEKPVDYGEYQFLMRQRKAADVAVCACTTVIQTEAPDVYITHVLEPNIDWKYKVHKV